MIYIIGVVGLVIVALLGAVRMQQWRVDAAVAQRDQAEAANKSLAASIDNVKRQCDIAIAKARRDADRRKADAKAAADKADEAAASQRSYIGRLIDQANRATVSADNCANAEKVLNDLAIDRNK